MPNNSDWQVVIEQILRILTFLDRPVIRWQLAAFFFATMVAWLLSYGLWHWVGYRFAAWFNMHLAEKERRYWQCVVLFAKNLTFPFLGFVVMQVTINIFEALGWRAGLIVDWGTLFSFVLYYRILLSALYIILGHDYMARYHYRLLAPLFGLFIAYWVFSYLLNLNRLSEMVLLEPFGNPVKVGAVVTALVALYFLFFGSRAIQDLLLGVIVPRTNTDPNVVNAGLTIGRYVVISGAVVIVAAALGVDPRALAIITGGLSVGIGFGLQEIVANFVSGIVLLFEQSLRPGDVVSMENEMGTVRSLGIRATTVRTRDNVEVIVPNQAFLTSAVTTYTKTDRIVRVKIPVGVSYRSDPDEVQAILLAVARQHAQVQKEPEPIVRFMHFGNSSIDFRLEVWVEDPMLTPGVRSDLRFMIWKAFSKYNIEIPFPQHDLHLRSGVPWEQLGTIPMTETIEPEMNSVEMAPQSPS